MSENGSIFVIVAAFNEQRVIAATVTPLLAKGYTVVVVDDGSAEPMSTVLSGFPVVLIRHSFNLGQGAALQTGMEYAIENGAQVLVHFDADGQHDANQIPEMVAPIRDGAADVVLGSRFLRASDLNQVPRARRLLLRVARTISGLLTRVWLSDTHNGFRALSVDAARHINLRESGFSHATEILSQIREAKLRYAEAPTTIRYSEYSRAKGQPMANSFRVFFDLILRKLLP